MKSAILAFLPALLLSAATSHAQPAAQQPLLPMAQARNYVCTDGNLVVLSHDAASGILRGIRGGEEFTLQEQVGRSKARRFVNDSDTVILAGNVALLRRGKDVRQRCTGLPAAPVAGTVWGTITKLDRMALVPGTRAKVLLVDAARADAPAIELGSFQITTSGNQVPLWFVIDYDAERTRHPASPRLQARIETPKGQLMYITDTANMIPNDGTAAPSPIDLQLVRTGSQ